MAQANFASFQPIGEFFQPPVQDHPVRMSLAGEMTTGNKTNISGSIRGPEGVLLNTPAELEIQLDEEYILVPGEYVVMFLTKTSVDAQDSSEAGESSHSVQLEFDEPYAAGSSQ